MHSAVDRYFIEALYKFLIVIVIVKLLISC